jgi:hypothetical protein
MRLPSMESSAFTMLEILTSGQLTSKDIYIAAKLRIADYLRDGLKDIEKLAKELVPILILFIGYCACWLALEYLLKQMEEA